MYCTYCGKLIADDSYFCQYCGKSLHFIHADDKTVCEDTETVFEEETTVSDEPASDGFDVTSEPEAAVPATIPDVPVDIEVLSDEEEETSGSVSTVLTLGILATALCETGLPGVILGIVGRRKAKQYVKSGKPHAKQVKIGNILSTVGFGVGIGVTVFWALWILLLILMITYHTI